ncbi:hypothetical protein VB715_18755 [Crocosphaera sp. UHCC 0190]|uniref:hypothetical protein n=1 Tax=Crocosphaera sp. UHCC 0190 TaxID=3110246 RepID=UPI002B212D9D|nr:hypothetical protein [Crocosphaera sp. UHCC 0190]MEA5511816.1 hypothetical protein [Crocosphaera sp. UHCC 0190]
MNTQSTIALLTIAILGFSHPSQAQMTITPQEGDVYPTRTCYVIFDDGVRHPCNGLGVTSGNSSVNYHFAVYDYSQPELSPLVAVAFVVPKNNLSSVVGVSMYTAEGLTLSLPATGLCQITSQEITCNAVTSYGDKFAGYATP